MAIGIGDEGKIVKSGDTPVHVRIGGKSGFQGKDLPGQITKTLFNGVKAGFGAKQRKPRRPDMGRDEKAIGRLFQGYCQ